MAISMWTFQPYVIHFNQFHVIDVICGFTRSKSLQTKEQAAVTSYRSLS